MTKDIEALPIPKSEKNWQKIIIISILVWFVLVSLAAVALNYKLNQNNENLKAALNFALDELAINNQKTLDSLNTKIIEMNETVAAVTNSIANTDQTLASDGAASRAEMAKQIEALNKELNSLRASLKLLQEDKK